MEISSNNNSDEREEGEIVEDDLEDVSDCSIIAGSPINCGKSVSTPELLSPVCLSNVSSSDFTNRPHRHRRIRNKILYYEDLPPRRICRRKRKLRQQATSRKSNSRSKTQKKPVLEYISDSDVETVDPKYARQLRDALKHTNVSDEPLHNSLKTRLGFHDISSQSEDDLSLSILRDKALISTIKDRHGSITPLPNVNNVDTAEALSSKETASLESKKHIEEEEPAVENDPELQELRSAALKSVIIKNHEERRKRKAIHNGNKHDNGSNKSTNDVDKENDQCIINNDTDNNRPNKKLKLDIEKNDEDQVVLVVEESNDNEVLVKVAEKIADCIHNNSPEEQEDNLEDDPDIMRAKLLAAMSTKLTSKPIKHEPITSEPTLISNSVTAIRKIENARNLQKISNPILGNVKDDFSKAILNNKKLFPTPAIAQITVKPLIINLNADSDSDTEISISEQNNTIKQNVMAFLKKQRAEVEASTKKKITTNLNHSNDLLDKSAIKILPRSQQLEYFKLKQQMRKRLRLRKLSQRITDNKKEIVVTKKLVKTKSEHPVNLHHVVVNTISNNNSSNNNKVVKNNHLKNEELSSSDLTRALNDLQVRRNGRLQMKGKYRSLVPLLNKITQASKERLEHETTIKKLLQEIQKARIKLAASHQNFTTLVQNLVNEKDKIDRGSLKLSKIPTHNNNVFTSTPKTKVVITTNKEPEPDKIETEEVQLPVEIVSETGEDKDAVTKNIDSGDLLESKDAANEEVLEDLNNEVLVIPNEITKVLVDVPDPQFSTLPKYVSPLDSRDTINPLGMFCLHDLSGVCKDAECPYVHCS